MKSLFLYIRLLSILLKSGPVVVPFLITPSLLPKTMAGKSKMEYNSKMYAMIEQLTVFLFKHTLTVSLIYGNYT